MPKPFDDLRETLLRAGIAPRHVRAYVTELREHLLDLTEQECAAGGDAREALARARGRLGDDPTLAGAMLARPGLRSWTARAPLLVFGLFPTMATHLTLLPLVLLLVRLAHICGFIVPAPNSPHHLVAMPAAAWYRDLVLTLSFVGNLAGGVLLTTLLVVLALRQRSSMVWPILGVAVIAVIWPHIAVGFTASNRLAGLGYAMQPLFRPRVWPHLTWATILPRIPILLPALGLLMAQWLPRSVISWKQSPAR